MLKVRGQLVTRKQILVICGIIFCLPLLILLLDHPRTRYILKTVQLKSAFSLASDYTHLVNINFTFNMLPLICIGDEEPLLILVHSATNHFNNRKVIRETWGQYDDDIRLLFLVGTANGKDIQEKLEEESKQHSDLLQGNFVDTYHNLTYKHVMGLKYAVYHCSQAKFVLKVDDDVFVNIPTLKMFIATYICQNRQPTKILCSRIRNPTVLRSGKWATSLEDYPAKNYPTHCGGFAIFYPQNVISTLYEMAQKTKFFWVDDVFVTGICAKQSNITHIGIEHLVLSTADVHNIVDLSFTNITKPFLIGRINLNENQIRSLWKFGRSHTSKTILDYLDYN
ncbi:beta-1,3-galactosyltransferase 5-like [Anoplophora glabripennis]|uniref:beta-1,3-galactosyltransferase 5-like n=1 Tax=Anoplophora glabripennis TaxID=217634 RepID=UPI000875A629|nr:beta-1,3-galactosyltransferase 5-like [Anoplophora glabripennis]